MEVEQWQRRLSALLAMALMVLALPLRTYAYTQYDSRQELVNEADLNPTPAKSQVLDVYLDNLMEDLLRDSMDTYEKLVACYDYVADNTSYGNHMGYLGTVVSDGVTCGDIYNSYGEIEGFGAVALTAGTGMCNAYASAFILMARKLGLDADLVTGSTKNGGGGYSYHEWAEVTIDGGVYLFDPQLEHSLTASGLQSHSVFFKTYDEVPGRFVRY